MRKSKLVVAIGIVGILLSACSKNDSSPAGRGGNPPPVGGNGGGRASAVGNAPGSIADGIGSGYDYSPSGQLRESKSRRYTNDGSMIMSTFECRRIGNEAAGVVLYLNVNNDSMILEQPSQELHLERETNDFSENDKNDLFWKVAYFGKQSVLGDTVFTHAFIEPAIFTKTHDQIRKDGIALSLKRGDVTARYSYDGANYTCK